MKTENAATATKPVVTAETNVQPAPTAKAAITAVNDRKYKLSASCPSSFKGAQRQIVRNILANSKEPMTPAEVAPLADAAGLKSITPTLASVRYHLHHLQLLGFAEVTK